MHFYMLYCSVSQAYLTCVTLQKRKVFVVRRHPDAVVYDMEQAQRRAAPTSFLHPALLQTGQRLFSPIAAETATSSTGSMGGRLPTCQITWSPRTWRTSSPWRRGWNTGPVGAWGPRRKPYCVTLIRLVWKRFRLNLHCLTEKCDHSDVNILCLTFSFLWRFCFLLTHT